MNCYLCNSKEYQLRQGKVRDDHSIEIRECSQCGLVYLSKQKKCDYEKSEMHESAPPATEIAKDDLRRFNYVKGFIQNKDVLDFGCGQGGFIAFAETIANKVYGVELEERYTNGTTVFQYLSDIDKTFDFITAFHVIEHLENPIKILMQLKDKLKKGGSIIIEVPSSDDALLTLYENVPFSEFTYWSCHLHLFNQKTLTLLLQKAGLKIDYIEHIQRYPLSNHLYWLAKGLAGGHNIWSFLDSKDYETKLASIGKTDTLIARCK